MEVQKLVKYEQGFSCSGKCASEAMFRVTVGYQLVESKAISCSSPTEFVVPFGSQVILSLEFEDGNSCTREIVSGESASPEGCFGELILLSETQVDL